MSDDQRSTPTEPYAARPQPQAQAIQPYTQPGPSVAPYGHATVLPVGGAFTHRTVAAPRVGSAHIVIALGVRGYHDRLRLALGYLSYAQKSNTMAIALLNLLVGWTLIGWIAALVMSVQNEPRSPTWPTQSRP